MNLRKKTFFVTVQCKLSVEELLHTTRVTKTFIFYFLFFCFYLCKFLYIFHFFFLHFLYIFTSFFYLSSLLIKFSDFRRRKKSLTSEARLVIFFHFAHWRLVRIIRKYKKIKSERGRNILKDVRVRKVWRK
jgi:hypothetical protein